MSGTNAAKRAMFAGAARGTVSTGQVLAAILIPTAAVGAIYISMGLAGLDPARVAATWFPALADWLDAAPYPDLPAAARNIAAGWIGVCIIALFATWQKFRIDPTADRHLSGRRLIDVPRRTRRSQEKLCRVEGRGIPLGRTADGTEIPLTRAQETRHLFIVGGVGAGKTNTIRPMLDAARARQDRVLVYDNKGDFYPSLTGPDEDIILLAPWDRRTWRWDVARDVRTRADAAAFAEALIPQTGDPFWSNASRAIAVALIVRLQKERPDEWRFSDLADLVAEGFGAIRETVAAYYPEAILLIDGAGGADAEDGEGATAANKTAQSILANLIAGLVQLFQLVDAWDRCDVAGAISIREWLGGDYSGPKTIILAGNKSMQPLERAVAQAVLGVIQRTVSSPEMPDSDSRRVWLFLDEFPQLSRIENFGQFLEIGRSKGIRVVLGLQSIPQIERVYSREELQTWSSLVGGWLIGRTGGSESPRWLSELIGEREVLRWLPSYSRSRVRAAGAPVPTQSEQWQQIRVPVVPPDQLSLLRPGEFYFLPLGAEEVHLFRFRQLTPAEKEFKRPHFQPAAWLSPGWPENTGAQVAAAVGAPAPGGDQQKPQREQEQQEKEEEREQQDECLITETTTAHRAHVAPAASAGGDVIEDAITRAEVEQVAAALGQVLPGFGALLESLHLASEITDAPLQIEQAAVTRARPQQLEEPRRKRRKKRKHQRAHEEEQEL